MPRPSYPTDLIDEQWALLEPAFEEMRQEKAPQGRPRTIPYREIVNALMYLTRTGAAWRMMPHDLPPWDLVYHYFHEWSRNGFLERLNKRPISRTVTARVWCFSAPPCCFRAFD